MLFPLLQSMDRKYQEPQGLESQDAEVQDPADEADVQRHEAQNSEAQASTSQDHTCNPQDPVPQRDEEKECIAHRCEALETGMEIAIREPRCV